MKIKFYADLCLSMFLLTACSKDETEETLSIAGYYRVSQMTSDIAVDIDDDGLTGTDMMNEAAAFFTDSYRNDLIIKYNESFHPSVKIIDFMLPHMNMYFEYPGTPQGFNTFTHTGPHALFEYDYKERIITIDESNGDDEFGRIISTRVVDNDHINAVVKKKFYDFHAAQWVELTLSIQYYKINGPQE